MRPEERAEAEAAVRWIAAEKGYEVLRLTISNGRVLCVTLDADPSPVTINDATWMNHRIRDALVKAGLPADDYQVEVESPGVRRPLHTLRHFERFIGERARVKLRAPRPDGNRLVIGIIEDIQQENESVVIGFAKAEPVIIPLADISEATLDPDTGPDMVFFSILVLWIVALCLHEYSHARTAFAGGDISVAAKGYLSLNPLRYVHPVTSIVIPLIVLAAGGIPLPGGAVYIDMTRIRSRGWQSAVSAAGPAADLGLFILFSLPFTLGLADANPAAGTLWPTLAFSAFLQIFCVLLNLLPVPGLDGFGVLEPWLPWTWRRTARLYGNIFMIGLLGVMITPNPLSDGLSELALRLTLGIGIPPEAFLQGWTEFKRFKLF